jgi:L-amino acid N-acyltransferase YncA
LHGSCFDDAAIELAMTATIRLATEEDAGQIRDIYAPVCLHTPISFEEAPPDEVEIRQRIRKISARFPWVVCERGGEVLGYVYGGTHRERAAYRWSVEVTAYVHQDYHRKGIGRALYTSLFRLLVLQGFYNAFAGITLPNPGSVGLHEALGFRSIGLYTAIGFKLGRWHDVGWYQLDLQPRPAVPPEPRDIHVIRSAIGWDAALCAGAPLLRV